MTQLKKTGTQHYRRMAWVSASLGLVAGLYAWVVGAAAPAGASNANTNTMIVLTTGAITPNPIDPNVQTMVNQVESTVQTTQNNAILQDMYTLNPNSTTPPLSPANSLVVQHLGNFCNGTNETGNCPSDPSLMFGDIKISSVLEPSTYDAQSLAAAQALVQTLLTPLDSSAVTNFLANTPINANTLSTNTTLQQQWVQALSDESILSMVRQVFAEMMAIRTATAGGSQAQPLPSEMALMEQEVMQRFMNSRWTTKLSTLTAVQLQQEMALMQAFQNYMALKNYKQQERVEALLATTVLQNYRNQKNSSAVVSSATNPPSISTAPTDTSDTSQ